MLFYYYLIHLFLYRKRKQLIYNQQFNFFLFFLLSQNELFSATFFKKERVFMVLLYIYLPQILQNQFVQPFLFLQLLLKLGFQGGKTFGKVEVIFLFGQTHITARREHIIQLRHPTHGHGGAEAGNVLIIGRLFTPQMIGVGYLLNILIREFSRATVDKVAFVTGVNEEDFASAFGAVAGHKPQTSWNLGVQEQLGGQVYNTGNHSFVNQRLADLAFSTCLGGQ